MPSVTHQTGQLVDPVLTNLAKITRPEGFIAETVCPRVGVVKESGKYLVFNSRDFHATDVDAEKPDRAKTKEVDFTFTTESYSVTEYGLQSTISRRERENVDSQLRLEQNKLNIVLDQLDLAREVRVAALLNTIDAGGGLDNTMDATPANNWNVAAATIESDVLVAKEAIYDAIGREPNTIVLPYKVANAIASQEDIRELFRYTVNGLQQLSEGAGHGILPNRIFGLSTLIPTTRKYTNKEGATDVVADVWGDDVRILYIDPTPAYGVPSVAHTFEKRGRQVRRWEENDPEVTHILADEILSEQVISTFAGYVIKDVLS